VTACTLNRAASLVNQIRLDFPGVFLFRPGLLRKTREGRFPSSLSSCRSVEIVEIVRSSLQAWARDEFHRSSSLLIVSVLLAGRRII